MSSIVRTVSGTHIVVESLDDIKHEFDNSDFVTLTEIVGLQTDWETQAPLWLNRATVVSASKLIENSGVPVTPPLPPLD